MVSYTLQARVFTEHGANPHLVPPSAFPGDPLYPYMTYWFDEPSIYGPLWTLLITPLSLLAGDDMLLHYLLFKLLAIFALQGSAVLAAQIVARLGNGYAMAAFLGVAWNPLLLFECGANGHNDIIMAFLALLTLHCVGLNRPVAALLSLTASVLVKFVTALLAPFVLLAVCGEAVRRIVSWRRLVVGLGLSLALVVVSYLPFWQGLQTIGFLQRSTFYTTSPAAVAYFWLYDLGQPGLAALASWPGYLLFAAVAACLWVSWVRGATLLSDGMFDVMLAYLLLATPWFQPWYLCLLVPLAAVTSGAFRRLLAYVFSLSAALQYFAFNFLWSWNRQAWEMKEGQLLMTAIVFLPVWLLLVWRFVASLRRGGSSF